MKKSRTLLLILLILIFFFSLYLINKDLYHYEYTYPFSRIFSPEETTKGKYPVTDSIPLKKGRYELIFEGSAEGIGNGCYLQDSRDNEIISFDLPYGEFTKPFPIELTSNTPVRIGFSYDPDGGKLEIGKITLQGNHVLYKESVIRHALFSFFAALIFLYIGIRLAVPNLPETIKNKTGIDLPAREKIFVFLLALTILSFWPFFDLTRFTLGDDFYFHISRIEGMALTMKAGYFPPLILLGWMENYGVGAGFYYPYLFMLFPSVLCMLGITAINSLRVFFFVCTFFSLLSIYISAKTIANGSHAAGTVSAALYAFAAYRLLCVFGRNAAGAVQAFMFLPLVLMGLVEILRGNVGRWKIFFLGFFGLLMSHMISLTIAGVLCAICLLFYLPRILRNKEIFFAFLKAAVLTILLGAFFLLPMVEQSRNNYLEINDMVRRPFEPKAHNLMTFRSIFLAFDPWDHVHHNDHVYPGYALLFVPVMRIILFLLRKKDPRMKTADLITLTGVLLLFVGSDLFPWSWPVFSWFLAKIQFSWRFYGALSMLLCTSGGIYFDILLSSIKHRRLAVAGMLVIAILSGFPFLVHVYRNMLYPIEMLTTSNKVIGGVEYVPPKFDYVHLDRSRSPVIYDETQTRIFDNRRQNLGYVFSFEREGEGKALDYSLPLVYFYGYTGTLTDKDGSVRKIPVIRDEAGLASVSDEGLSSGTIRIRYEKTPALIAGEIISLITLAAFLIFEFYESQKRKSMLRKQCSL